MLGPVPEHAEAYLDRPLTDDEKRRLGKAAAVPGPRIPDESLQDLERLRDKGYLSTQEYEAKRTEIIEGF